MTFKKNILFVGNGEWHGDGHINKVSELMMHHDPREFKQYFVFGHDGAMRILERMPALFDVVYLATPMLDNVAEDFEPNPAIYREFSHIGDFDLATYGARARNVVRAAKRQGVTAVVGDNNPRAIDHVLRNRDRAYTISYEDRAPSDHYRLIIDAVDIDQRMT